MLWLMGTKTATVLAAPRRSRGRPPKLGVERPACPRGHHGRISLDGVNHNRFGTNARTRFRCFPDDGKTAPHVFQPSLRHRHPTSPGTHECDTCERGLRRDDGPVIGVKCEFSIREAAHVLMRMGQRGLYREVAEEVRGMAEKRPRKASLRFARDGSIRRHITAGDSDEPNTVMTYVDVFADFVIEELREKAWPSILIVDAQPFHVRGGPPPPKLMFPESNKKPAVPVPVVTRERGRILAAFGKEPGGNTRPILMRFMGGGDKDSWVEFFETLPGTPTWIVSDRDMAIAKAIKHVWGTRPVHYFSHPHIVANAIEAAGDDIGGKDDPLRQALDKVLTDPGRRYDQIRQDARARGAYKLDRWLTRNRALIFRMAELRKQYPRCASTYSTGDLEAHLQKIKKRFADIFHLFHNAARLDRLLGLIVADFAGLANETRYSRILRRWFIANGGFAAAEWARSRDPRGTSSIDDLVAAAGARQGRARRKSQLAGNARRAPIRQAQREQDRQAAGHPAAPPPRAKATKTSKGTPVSLAGKHVADYPTLVAQWHPSLNGEVRLEDIRATSRDHYTWVCDAAPDHLWSAQVASRARGAGCPYCAGRRVAPSGSLAALFPDIAAQWHPKRNMNARVKTPEECAVGSDLEVWWQCPLFRTHVYKARLNSRTRLYTGCPRCAAKAGSGGRPKRRRGQKPEATVVEIDELRRQREERAPETG